MIEGISGLGCIAYGESAERGEEGSEQKPKALYDFQGSGREMTEAKREIEMKM